MRYVSRRIKRPLRQRQGWVQELSIGRAAAVAQPVATHDSFVSEPGAIGSRVRALPQRCRGEFLEHGK